MIRVFRLTTGEDLIGDKQESGQDTTTIKKPFVLLPMQPAPGKPVSVGFTPYSPYANSDTITIKTANIISEVEPKTELANAYKKNTGTGIMEPTIKEKQFITENPLPDLK
jgi:hypothetical protein|tara:strand:+ start:1973 stop:2302 length:330 start_codon:yes stop_codon:yes gene_type:complete